MSSGSVLLRWHLLFKELFSGFVAACSSVPQARSSGHRWCPVQFQGVQIMCLKPTLSFLEATLACDAKLTSCLHSRSLFIGQRCRCFQTTDWLVTKVSTSWQMSPVSVVQPDSWSHFLKLIFTESWFMKIYAATPSWTELDSVIFHLKKCSPTMLCLFWTPLNSTRRLVSIITDWQRGDDSPFRESNSTKHPPVRASPPII